MNDHVFDRMKAYIAEQTALPVETIEAVLRAEDASGIAAESPRGRERRSRTRPRRADRPQAGPRHRPWERSRPTGRAAGRPRARRNLRPLSGMAHLRLEDRTSGSAPDAVHGEHGLGENSVSPAPGRPHPRTPSAREDAPAARCHWCSSGRTRSIPTGVFCLGCGRWCDFRPREEADRTRQSGGAPVSTGVKTDRADQIFQTWHHLREYRGSVDPEIVDQMLAYIPRV